MVSGEPGVVRTVGAGVVKEERETLFMESECQGRLAEASWNGKIVSVKEILSGIQTGQTLDYVEVIIEGVEVSMSSRCRHAVSVASTKESSVCCRKSGCAALKSAFGA